VVAATQRRSKQPLALASSPSAGSHARFCEGCTFTCLHKVPSLLEADNFALAHHGDQRRGTSQSARGRGESVKRKKRGLAKLSLKRTQQAIKSQAAQAGNSPAVKLAPELNMPNPEGEILTLESLRGKVVLIDFWASWCGPCRRENPNVVRLYNQYKDQGFEVFSVSLDKDKARWEAAIIKDNLNWSSHVSDLKGWGSAATSLYGFRGIPYTVLIDREGKIIQTRLRGAALEKKLEEIFSK